MHNKKGIRRSAWNRVKYSQDRSLVRSRPQAEASAFPRGEILCPFRALLRLALFLFAGHSYRMLNIIIVDILVNLACARVYFVLGIYYESIYHFLIQFRQVITAFHRRAFSEPFLYPGAPQLWVTAFEAIMDLVIEGVFIAMLTQKFFGK